MKDILFLGKKDNPFVDQAAEYVKSQLESHIIRNYRAGHIHLDSLEWRYAYVISFLYPDIITEDILTRADIASINFHPGPPEYPGIGCTNQALYNKAKQYGVTCHHMNTKVDTGDIIDVQYFNINTETVYSLTQKCYTYMLTQFYWIIDKLLNKEELPVSKDEWKRKPYTRRQLDELCKINTNMTDEEIKLRVHATTYPDKPGANIQLGGINFEYKEKI